LDSMDDLSEDEVSAFHLRAARPELLDPGVDLSEPLAKQLAHGMVRSVVRSARSEVNGLRDADEAEPSDEILGQFAVEELMFCLHMIDRTAFMDSTLEQRRNFMDELVGATAGILWSSFAPESDAARFARYFTSIYNARQKEYASYSPPPQGRDENQKGTILWEYGKRMAALLSPAKSAFRVLIVGNLAMQYLTGLVPLVRKAASPPPPE
jgi:hypothetical protein